MKYSLFIIGFIYSMLGFFLEKIQNYVLAKLLQQRRFCLNVIEKIFSMKNQTCFKCMFGLKIEFEVKGWVGLIPFASNYSVRVP